MRRLSSEFLFIRPLSDGCVQEKQAAILFSKVKSAHGALKDSFYFFIYSFPHNFSGCSAGLNERRRSGASVERLRCERGTNAPPLAVSSHFPQFRGDDHPSSVPSCLSGRRHGCGQAPPPQQRRLGGLGKASVTNVLLSLPCVSGVRFKGF